MVLLGILYLLGSRVDILTKKFLSSNCLLSLRDHTWSESHVVLLSGYRSLGILNIDGF